MSDINGETPVTKEQLEAAHAQQLAALEDEKLAHMEALEAFDEARRSKATTTEQLIELASAVKKAETDIGLREKLVTKAADNVSNFAYIAKRDVRNAAQQRIHDATQAAIAAEREVLIDCGVDKLTFSPVEIGEGTPTVEIKPHGVGVGKVSTPRAPRANGEGAFTSRGSVTVDGVEYSSLNKAYMTLRAQAEDKEMSEITPANSESATRWLTKQGHTIA